MRATFERDGLRYRPWGARDLDALAALVTDPVIMARVGGALRTDEVAGLLDRYRRPDDPRVLAALCIEDEAGAPIGSGLVTREDDALEIGFLVRREHQGRGHGTRIARALVELAQTRSELVIARVAIDHAASIRVLEKAGLRVASRTPDHLVMERRTSPDSQAGLGPRAQPRSGEASREGDPPGFTPGGGGAGDSPSESQLRRFR
ncbi:GNAT family N-acetyltransferase [Sandaracinus amylolyticus]|uniref:GNAT family N-acetyltransferase n=1 Tax=Sandaracinus amylolyticus TaxID=927083 RepID=UPI001F254F98|nr:GNAT family N-acetyltransferase [Sandaracinus amylolyticus]UJR87109.1 Hypothetical protein I5071_92100 [Sandaracinus amylolyticus]